MHTAAELTHFPVSCLRKGCTECGARGDLLRKWQVVFRR